MGFRKQLADAIKPIFTPAQDAINNIVNEDWASPRQPIRPIIPPGLGVRSWNFHPATNLDYTPRGDRSVSFGMLANFANSWDVCRLIIETKKDQISNRKFVIRIKQLPGETKKQRLQRESNDSSINKIARLFEHPDGTSKSARTWLREWVEQLLVYDAPCIYPVRNVLGDVMFLRVIDGATITPLIDEQGFMPMPPSPAYQQIILGIPVGNLEGVIPAGDPRNMTQSTHAARPYTADQLIYTPRNPRCNSRWGFPPVEQVIATLGIAARRQTFLNNFYTEGNIPEALVQLPETWHTDQIKSFQNWFDEMLSGNLRNKRKLIFVPGASGSKIEWAKKEALTDETEEYLIRVLCFAFSCSAQGLIKQMNRASAENMQEVATEEGIEPILKFIEDTMSFIIANVLGYPDVEFAFLDARETDPLKQSTTDKTYLSCAVYTINEIRAARGEDPRPEKEADMLGCITPTGFVPIDGEVAAARAQAMAPASTKGNGMDANDDKGTPGPGKDGTKPPPVPHKVAKNADTAQVTMPGSVTFRNEAIQTMLEKSVRRFFKSQRRTLSAAAERAYSALLYNPAADKAAEAQDDDAELNKHIAEALALMPWNYELLTEDLRSNLTEAAKDGARQGSNQISSARGLRIDESFGPSIKAAVDYGTQRATDLTGDNPDAEYRLIDAARDEVGLTFRQAVEENWTPEQLKSVIAAVKALSDDRANLIAGQETLRAQSKGWVSAWAASRQVEKVAWRLSPLHKGVDICDVYASHGDVTLGHAFDKGVYLPTDAHPNCGCYLEIVKFAEA